ncbi:MAG: hypothetical protein NVS3B16_25320 [Vulcanimicrobiaceae bacterium]
MSNSSTITIACALCVGGARELYLAPALAAIADAVDALVVNDNSGLAHSDNVALLERSAFAARGALHVERHPFRDFADMRDRAFAGLAKLERRPDWVLFLDADEVHGEQIRYIAREILPRLGPSYGSVDAYTYHFFGTFRWITDVARRFVFYRYAPELRWEHAVHEKIVGLRGKALVLPYAYHHYGNVVPPAMLARKHGRYFELGNPVPEPPPEAAATAEIFLAQTAGVRPYRLPHPRVARATLAAVEAEFSAAFAPIDAGFRARRTAAMRAAATLRGANEALRVALRRIEHPLVYRAGTRAR